MFSTSRAQNAVINGIIFCHFNIEHKAFLNDYYNRLTLNEGLLYCFKHLLCAAQEVSAVPFLQMWKQYEMD